jgi:hypothetical protein
VVLGHGLAEGRDRQPVVGLTADEAQDEVGLVEVERAVVVRPVELELRVEHAQRRVPEEAVDLIPRKHRQQRHEGVVGERGHVRAAVEGERRHVVRGGASGAGRQLLRERGGGRQRGEQQEDGDGGTAHARR